MPREGQHADYKTAGQNTQPPQPEILSADAAAERTKRRTLEEELAFLADRWPHLALELRAAIVAIARLSDLLGPS